MITQAFEEEIEINSFSLWGRFLDIVIHYLNGLSDSRVDSGQLGLELDLSSVSSVWLWESYEISPEPQFLLMESGEGWE